jgi:hypothetical protein
MVNNSTNKREYLAVDAEGLAVIPQANKAAEKLAEGAHCNVHQLR